MRNLRAHFDRSDKAPMAQGSTSWSHLHVDAGIASLQIVVLVHVLATFDNLQCKLREDTSVSRVPQRVSRYSGIDLHVYDCVSLCNCFCKYCDRRS